MEKKIKEVVYLDKDFNIVEESVAVLIKIFYEDNSIMFAFPTTEKAE